jgi:hypothetical protein
MKTANSIARGKLVFWDLMLASSPQGIATMSQTFPLQKEEMPPANKRHRPVRICD